MDRIYIAKQFADERRKKGAIYFNMVVKENPMLMIGYGENHARDVYRMYNPATSKVVETRDIHTWADIKNATNNIRLTMSKIYDLVA